jgi:glutaredoxin 2
MQKNGYTESEIKKLKYDINEYVERIFIPRYMKGENPEIKVTETDYSIQLLFKFKRSKLLDFMIYKKDSKINAQFIKLLNEYIDNEGKSITSYPDTYFYNTEDDIKELLKNVNKIMKKKLFRDLY